MAELNLSNHSRERMHERVGLKKGSIKRMALKAYENGIKHSETTGQLNKYLTKLYFNSHDQGKCANNIRVYNHYVYIFIGRSLITVLPLPNRLVKIEESIKQRKKEERITNERKNSEKCS